MPYVLLYVPKVKKEEGHSSNLQENALRGLTLPIRRIDAINLSSKLQGKSIPQNQAEYNPNEPSMLGELPSEDKTRQAREGLGYRQPPPIHISIRRESNNHITIEDDVIRLGLLKKKNNKHQKSYLRVTMLASAMIQKNFKSLIPSRIRRRVELLVSCKEELKAKTHTVVYTKGRKEDEKKEEVVGDALPELEEGVKTTTDPLMEVNLGTDEDPRPTYLSDLLEVDEEIAYMNILQEYRDVFIWSYKEVSGLNPKVAVRELAAMNGYRPVKHA
ncbi:hypothetical protein KY290_021252 [Solanum tuberosum]|uniref:Uncharacterized protein n=1 Tax=Solanum tuberosum TaxID=4113 RepID=A0ABQ7V133_SOLTU|nr:hypothetical protein KY289_020420 [Solanum tuberosum]KAH0693079.1 hypothetical protein KY285_020176 [Solanum tuberosum]KAH0757759.1 hypothetical protein KY290_021252 [Solanum tuberosum]